MSPSPEDLIHVRAQARILLSLIAIAWLIHLINWGLLQGALNRAFCLRPRNAWGLVGIPCAPLLHGSWPHLIGNTQAFLILGWLVSMQGMRLFYFVTIALVLLTGIALWLFGRGPGVGASGVTFGYTGFLLLYGITVGELAAFLVALIVLFVFRRNIVGGDYIASGMLPGPNPRLGWDAHLFGFISGIFLAYLLSDLKLNY